MRLSSKPISSVLLLNFEEVHINTSADGIFLPPPF